MFKTILKNIITPILGFFGFVQASFAALPAAVPAAIAEAQTDGVELAGLLLGMAVAVGVILWLKRKA